MSSPPHEDEEISSSHQNVEEHSSSHQNVRERSSLSGAGSSTTGPRQPPFSIDSSDFHLSAAESSDSVPLDILATDSQASLIPDHSSSIMNFEGITSSSIHSDLVELGQFGHHSLSEVDMPASMASSGGGFMWDDEMGDIFSFEVSDSSSLMHHPAIGNPVDRPDGANVPDSSSSNAGGKKIKLEKAEEQPSCSSSSRTVEQGRQQDPLDIVRSSSPFVQSPFTFEESDSELEQCTSSSDLIVATQNNHPTRIVPSGSANAGKVNNVLPDSPIEPAGFLANPKKDTSKGKMKSHRSHLAGSSHPSTISDCGVSVGSASAQEPHHLHVNIDDDPFTREATSPGRKAQCLPSDILTTISPPQKSAIIVPSVVTESAANKKKPSIPSTSEATPIDVQVHGGALNLNVSDLSQEGRLAQETSCVSDSGISPLSDCIITEEASRLNNVSSSERHPHNTTKENKPSGLSLIPAKDSNKASSGIETTPSSSNPIPGSSTPSQDDHIGSSVAVNGTSTTIPIPSVKSVTCSKQSTSSSSIASSVSDSAQSQLAPFSRPADPRSNSRFISVGNSSQQMQQSSTATTATHDAPDGPAVTIPLQEYFREMDRAGPSTASGPTSSGSRTDAPQSHHGTTDESRNEFEPNTSSGLEREVTCPRTDQDFNAASSNLTEMDVIDVVSSDGEGTKVAEDAPSQDSDESISDIDDTLEEAGPSKVDGALGSRGKKRTADGEDKGGGDMDHLRPGTSIEPSEEEKDRGVTSIKLKRVFVRRGREPLDGLPSDWIAVPHQAGLEIYMHRPTRVCTWSRPYFIGEGSIRRHRVPLAAIRCLHYKRAKTEDEAETAAEDSNKRQCIQAESKADTNGTTAATQETVSKPDGEAQPSTGGTDSIPPVPTEAGDNVAQSSTTEVTENGTSAGGDDREHYKHKLKYKPDEALDPDELHEYFKKVFEFKKIPFRRFESWALRRNYYKQERKKKAKAEKTKEPIVERPKLPLVPTFMTTVKNAAGDIMTHKKELAIPVTDKSPTSILQEYCQRVLKVHPQYVIEERNSAANPFEAIVIIDGQRYGKGMAPSKKQARINAALETLNILIPNVMAKTEGVEDTSMEFFNNVAIDDSRVGELCMKTGNLTPYEVLNECKQRMFGKKDTEFDFKVTVNAHAKITYKMSLGPHTAEGPCKNAKVGKQLGAQKILQQIYPKVKTWGGIIKIYGRGIQELLNEKKAEEKKIFALSKVEKNKPNEKILQKLKEEMRKAYGAKIQAEKVPPADKSMQSQHQQAPVPSQQAKQS